MTNETTKHARLFTFMEKRENIRKLKDSGSPLPYSDDPILQKYHFTNVSRNDDWTTQMLVKNHYDPHVDDHAHLIIYNAITARSIGLYETVVEIGWQQWCQIEHVFAVIRRREAAGLPVFTPAYQIATGKDGLFDRLQEGWSECKQLARCAANYNTLDVFAHELWKLRGFGPFMAAQITLDLALTPVLSRAVDLDLFMMPGPGSQYALADIYGRLPERRTHLTKRELEKSRRETRRLWEMSRDHLPADMRPTMADLEHALCEFAKYGRIAGGADGRVYRPRAAAA